MSLRRLTRAAAIPAAVHQRLIPRHGLPRGLRPRRSRANARAALAASRAGLDELAFRRRGLAISLIFILAVAFGLALKIREIG